MGIYSNEARKEIDAVVRQVQQTPVDISGGIPYDRVAPSERPASYRNDSGETIPAYACMKLASGAKYSGNPPVPFFIASKPAATLLTDRFALNGPNPVDSGDHGICYLSGHTKGLYNTGTPVAGNSYGPTPGQWYLTKDYPPIFRVAVVSDSTPKHFYGTLHPIELLRGELKDDMPTSGSVAAGQTATAYFLNEAGAIVTAIEFEVTDVFGVYRGRAWVSGSERGSKLYAKYNPDSGKWEIVTMQPHALRISGDAGSAVYYDDAQFTLTGTPVIMNPSGALAMTDLTDANLIKNPLDLQFASGETLHAVWNEDVPQWEAIDGDVHRPHRISGVTSAAVPSGNSTFTLTGSPVIMNPIGAISEENYTAAGLIYNVFGFEIDSGGLIHAEYNEDSGHWECVQAKCPA